jgi:uncharacterized repeat protein (TIGR03847 family)
MPRIEIDLDPCDHITVDAIGQPGQRVFYIQAFQEQRTVTVIIEKAQVLSMSIGVEQFLSQIARQNVELDDPPSDYVEEIMHIQPPVDPLFRVGEIGIGYDKDRDMIVLFAKELLAEDADPESAGAVRFWCTRGQIRKMVRWGTEVAQRGRPLCRQCGQPIEPEGHFCPKKNGRLH